MKKNFISVFILFLLILLWSAEGLLFLGLNHPKLLRPFPSLLYSLKTYYEFYDRRIVQLDPACTQHHPELTYTFIPNHSCTIDYREAKGITYQSNSMGLRDTEDALKAPEIIVLGDSYALGWGVKQEETYSKILEKNTQLKTLNTGISSYGTAREMLLFKKLDSSKLKYLLIDYCENDYDENLDLIKNSFKLTITPQKEYEKKQQEHVQFSYHPFFLLKQVLTLRKNYPYLANWYKQREIFAYEEHMRDAAVFLQVMQHFEDAIPSHVPIILFESGDNLKDDYFLLAVKELAKTTHPLKHPLYFLSTKDLTQEDFYILDAHMNAHGHQKMAQKLQKLIEEMAAGKVKEKELESDEHFHFDRSLGQVIEDFGPKSISKKTLPQNIWLKGKNFTRFTQVFVDGKEIPNPYIVDRENMTLTIPLDVSLNGPIAKLNLEDKELKIKSNFVKLPIEEKVP